MAPKRLTGSWDEQRAALARGQRAFHRYQDRWNEQCIADNEARLAELAAAKVVERRAKNTLRMREFRARHRANDGESPT